MDTVREAVCTRCSGPVVVAGESSHPCGVYVQHGRCAACDVQLWRLLDGLRVPVTDSRGRWTVVSAAAVHAVSRSTRRPVRATRPGDRPARRTDRNRP